MASGGGGVSEEGYAQEGYAHSGHDLAVVDDVMASADDQAGQQHDIPVAVAARRWEGGQRMPAAVVRVHWRARQIPQQSSFRMTALLFERMSATGTHKTRATNHTSHHETRPLHRSIVCRPHDWSASPTSPFAHLAEWTSCGGIEAFSSRVPYTYRLPYP